MSYGSSSNGGQQRSVLGSDGKPLPLATEADLKDLKRLVQIIVRKFYDDEVVIVVDQLVRFTAIPADLLASRLYIGTKELKVQLHRLIEDRLVRVHTRSELPPTDPDKPPPEPGTKPRALQRVYYYLDLPTLFSVVQWRILQIYKSIDKMTASHEALTSASFRCSRCGKTFTSFDVAHLLDIESGVLRCDMPGCGNEIEEDEDKERAKRRADKMQRFNRQFETIRNGLQSLQKFALPE